MLSQAVPRNVSVSLLQLVERRLASHRPNRKFLRPLMQRSAVALILKVIEGELNVLMIKRADRAGDPWSGHMAFPGGASKSTMPMVLPPPAARRRRRSALR